VPPAIALVLALNADRDAGGDPPGPWNLELVEDRLELLAPACDLAHGLLETVLERGHVHGELNLVGLGGDHGLAPDPHRRGHDVLLSRSLC